MRCATGPPRGSTTPFKVCEPDVHWPRCFSLGTRVGGLGGFGWSPRMGRPVPNGPGWMAPVGQDVQHGWGTAWPMDEATSGRPDGRGRGPQREEEWEPYQHRRSVVPDCWQYPALDVHVHERPAWWRQGRQVLMDMKVRQGLSVPVRQCLSVTARAVLHHTAQGKASEPVT